MLNNFLHHTTSVRRRTLVVAMALTASLAALSVASPAMAVPKGEYAVFADCPLENPELSGCIVARTESGEITIGKQTVPIVNTQTLQGGFIEPENPPLPGFLTFVGAKDGNTLSKTPQPVPGGLIGMINCKEITNPSLRKLCEAIEKSTLNAVTATTELAAPASSIYLNEGALLEPEVFEFFKLPNTALGLPVKFKLDNALLGNECYIGSNSNPIVLNLTTGTTKPPEPNKPIKGKPGTLSSRAEGGILVVSHNTLVDNSFAAPAAAGCGGAFSFLIDPIINAKIGLPSAAGHNTAILNGTLEQTGANAAKEHE